MKHRSFLNSVTVLAALGAGLPESAQTVEMLPQQANSQARGTASTASTLENPFVLMRADSSGNPTVAQHYSHRSHSSHSSHYSSR